MCSLIKVSQSLYSLTGSRVLFQVPLLSYMLHGKVLYAAIRIIKKIFHAARYQAELLFELKIMLFAFA